MFRDLQRVTPSTGQAQYICVAAAAHPQLQSSFSPPPPPPPPSSLISIAAPSSPEMLRLALRRATSGALSRCPKIPKFAAAPRRFGTEAPQSNKVAKEMINYALGLARSQRSGESYNDALLVLEQGLSNLRGQGDSSSNDAVGMLMLAISTLLYERGEFENALEKLKLVRQMENTSLPVRAAAWQGLVGLNLELGSDATSLILAEDCFPLLKNNVESCRSASNVLSSGIKATKGLADLVLGNLESAETFFNGCIDDDSEEGKSQIGNVFLCRGEFLHCTGNLDFAKDLYEKALNAYEGEDTSRISYLSAANMAPEEIHLATTCALGQILSQLGNFDAEEVLTKALKIAEDHFGSTHPKVGVVLTCIALMFRHKAKLEVSSSILIQEGLYRKAIDLLKAPRLNTEDDDVQVNKQDIIALARGGYADILCVQQNRKGEGEQLRKWAEAAWRNRRVSLAEALEFSDPYRAAVVDTRICRVL